MSHGTGELVTEALDYDGGRQVTVYVPPVGAEAIVYLADGGWHTERLSQALESARISSTMLVGVHGLQDDDGRLGEYVPGFGEQRFRYQPPAELPSMLARFYLVGGTQEPFFLGNAQRWAASLRDTDADVVMVERDGAHGDAFWAEEFPLMVAWAFGP